MDFKPGDIVWMKTGGPPMTIDVVHAGSREVHCVWFVPVAGGQRLQQHVFHVESLTSAEPSPQAAQLLPAAEGDHIYEEGDD